MIIIIYNYHDLSPLDIVICYITYENGLCIFFTIVLITIVGVTLYYYILYY